MYNDGTDGVKLIMDEVKINIIKQGGPIIEFGRILLKTPKIIAIDITLISKRCLLSGTLHGDLPPQLFLMGNEDSIGLKEGDEDKETTIELPEYENWDVFASSISRYTLNVCLMKHQIGGY